MVGVIEPQVLIDRTSGAITEEPNRTSGSTYSSDSSSPYSSDFDRAEPPAAASPGHSSLEEEEGEEGSAAPRPAGADEGDKALAYIPNLGNDRPVLPDDGLHWFVDTTDGSYRPAVGRSRPKRGEILYDGTKDDLLEEYGNLTGPAGAPAAEPSPARNRPQSGEYDNTFWYGLGKDGQPYFSRATGDRRKRIKSDVGKVSWTRRSRRGSSASRSGIGKPGLSTGGSCTASSLVARSPRAQRTTTLRLLARSPSRWPTMSRTRS